MTEHKYQVVLEWTGNKGAGTFDYRSYSRSHSIRADGKPEILGSSDSSFRGNGQKYNPEDLFLSSIASCHMLWYLHLCADSGVIVLKYVDRPQGVMRIDVDGAGKFTEIDLHPEVVVSVDSDLIRAEELHVDAHQKCFIANSVNVPILHYPIISKG